VIELIEAALVLGLASALAAVVLGQVLTRSVVAGHVAIAAFGLAGLAAGGGVVALCFAIVGLLALAIVQLFGWMLVDVDHDHLPPLLRRTRGARGLALVVFAAGLVVLSREALRRGELAAAPALVEPASPFDPRALGAFFFGAHSELAAVLGCLLAAGSLTALSLLRDEGADAG
jgi:TRAP-type C4-dicarboxylate transport system permease small subunit